MNGTKVGASVTIAERKFQTGIVCGKKQYSKQFVLVEISWNFKQWFDLVLVGQERDTDLVGCKGGC